eukprot:366480-Chlamydomonas_euryale.AAC.2
MPLGRAAPYNWYNYPKGCKQGGQVGEGKAGAALPPPLAPPLPFPSSATFPSTSRRCTTPRPYTSSPKRPRRPPPVHF